MLLLSHEVSSPSEFFMLCRLLVRAMLFSLLKEEKTNLDLVLSLINLSTRISLDLFGYGYGHRILKTACIFLSHHSYAIKDFSPR